MLKIQKPNDEAFSTVTAGVALTHKINRGLTQAFAHAWRSKKQEATLGFFNHLTHFTDIATEGRRFHEESSPEKKVTLSIKIF